MSNKMPLRILVAEDNEVNQAVIRGMLEFAGHDVDTADNGKNAIAALEATHYDLLIMDCMMPVMDGFAATRCIRAAGSPIIDPEIPILAITALATAEDRKQCLEAGMTGYISKPVMAKDLFAWIDRYFNADSRSAARNEPDIKAGNADSEAADLIRGMAPLLVRDAGQWQEELQSLCDGGQHGELGALAHKIRGTADVLGCTALSALTVKLECSAKAGDTDEARTLTERVIESLGDLVRDLRNDA